MSVISNMLNTNYYSAFFSANSANKNKAQDSISNLWSSYSNSNANAMNALSGLSEIKSGVSSVLASYDEAKNNFYDEFDEKISALKNSAEKIKKYDFNVGKDAITQTESTNEDGEKVTTTNYSKDLQAALDTVKGFVEDYNNSIKFLTDNSEISKRIGRLAQSFGDTTYRAGNYNNIGISVGSDGKMTIDEEKLADNIVNNPDKVSSILGKDGLAGKAESHVSMANAQRDRLFPSAKSMLGDQLSEAALYTGGAYANMTSMANVGNLINMMF